MLNKTDVYSWDKVLNEDGDVHDDGMGQEGDNGKCTGQE